MLKPPFPPSKHMLPAMETEDEERPLLLLQPPQVAGSEYTRDGSVDINKQPALKHSTGRWRACFLILGVEFCECLAFFAISKNLVTYLTTVLHESKVAAARNVSAWVGACFFTPVFGAFIADTYWGRYWTIVVFFPVYVVAMLVLIAAASLPVFSAPSSHGDVHRAVVYLGLYLAVLASGGVKPCASTFGADQFDINDPVERAKKGSFFNWYYFLISTSSLLSGTVIVWLQDNVGWAVGYAIPTMLMLCSFAAFLAGSRVYRFREMKASPLASLSQVVVATVRNWHLKLPDDSKLLYELPSATDASHKIKHSNQFRFFDKAAIVSAPSDSEFTAPTSPWRLCTVTQVEELKMLLRTFPIWASFVIFYAVSAQMASTLVEQGMFMDNRVGSFAIPPASLTIVSVLSILFWVPVYETVLVPLARRLTGNDKGFSQSQRLGIGQALCMLSMVYAALLEARRLAIAQANGLTDQSVPVPMSILWQAPVHLVHGAAEVFAGIGVTEFFYDHAPETMKSLCAALGQLALASGSYFNSLVLGIVAVATARGRAPGWIPDNLNEGHLDYFFWMMATLSSLNLALFVHYSMRHRGKITR
ncbi:protein NRT1/ PTR FAMILY 8.3-like [Phragmites australis]|uniref:protein NRT1/ PTR FAMILY 8.3-like n=1 Tax=Phragmites australis TaxID=29695 RepID=UPI002D7728C4|nr:protein NRT1/ PTR FAMILY 8.3-like [Phragmites australis]